MKIGSRQFDLSCPVVMGIINVTPDSFSDAGLYDDPQSAAEHATRLIDEGADILDIGGESTRPGARCVSPEEEIARVVPVIKRIRSSSDIPLSVDTRNASVAAAAIEAGADMINDVSSGCHDQDMLGTAARSGLPICLMHMRGTPETMQLNTTYNDLMSDVRGYLRGRIEAAERAGIDPNMIMVDPGIGFGKSAEDNINIVLNIDVLTTLGKPILIGTSRKSFIGNLLGYEIEKRLEPTLATLSKSYEKGVRVFRVHDVGPAKRYLSMVQLLNDHDASI